MILENKSYGDGKFSRCTDGPEMGLGWRCNFGFGDRKVYVIVSSSAEFCLCGERIYPGGCVREGLVLLKGEISV